MIAVWWIAIQVIGGVFILEAAHYLGGDEIKAGIEYFGRKPTFILGWLMFWPAIMLAVVLAIITKPN